MNNESEKLSTRRTWDSCKGVFNSSCPCVTHCIWKQHSFHRGGAYEIQMRHFHHSPSGETPSTISTYWLIIKLYTTTCCCAGQLEIHHGTWDTRGSFQLHGLVKLPQLEIRQVNNIALKTICNSTKEIRTFTNRSVDMQDIKFPICHLSCIMFKLSLSK